MTIDKAIEVLGKFPSFYDDVLDYDDIDALKLGIEALKAIKEMRGFAAGWKPTKLPGETKD